MIVVDTSVLVDLFRGRHTAGADRLRALEHDGTPFSIPAICCQEVLQGARDRGEWKRVHDVLRTQTMLFPREGWDTHVRAARIYYDCRRRGVTPRSTIDCLVAALVIECEGVLLHADADFERIAKVCALRTLA